MSFTMVTDDAPKSNSTGGNSNIDWEKVNAERREREEKVIALLETQDESVSICGVISGYVDLGIQERGEYEEEYNKDDPKHAEKLEKGSFVEDRYNGKLKKKVPTLCTPAKPAKAFTLAVDFPDYMMDYGGDIGEKPFRMFMGGSFFVKNPDSAEGKKMKIVQNSMYMTENTNNPQNKWALGQTSLPCKMGKAAGITDEHGLMTKDDIGKLLGKALQFEVRVWDKPSKDDPSKTFYTESLKFVGKLPKGMPEPDLSKVSIFGVNMGAANDIEMVKQLRAEHRNTMKLASNWEGSVLQKELEELRKSYQEASNDSSSASGSEAPKPDKKPAEKQPEPATPDEDDGWDDSIPF